MMDPLIFIQGDNWYAIDFYFLAPGSLALILIQSDTKNN